MNDALNMIALAKMAVVVIGIFMVPAITRKFASELSLPVGQMAMNRAALLAGGVGLALGKAAFAGGESLRSHSAIGAGSFGGTLKSLGSRMQGFGAEANDADSPSYAPQNKVKSTAGSALSKLGDYLENSALHHRAKKAGIEPPSLKDKVMKSISADPSVLAPILKKEQRFQDFLESQGVTKTPYSIHGRAMKSYDGLPQSRSSNLGPITFQENGMSSKEPLQRNFKEGGNTRGPSRDIRSPSIETHERPSISSQIQKISHRWTSESRIKRMFNPKDGDAK